MSLGFCIVLKEEPASEPTLHTHTTHRPFKVGGFGPSVFSFVQRTLEYGLPGHHLYISSTPLGVWLLQRRYDGYEPELAHLHGFFHIPSLEVSPLRL